MKVDASTPVLAEIIDAAGKDFTGAIEVSARGGDTPHEAVIYMKDGAVYAVTAAAWEAPVTEWATWKTGGPIPAGSLRPDEYAYQTRAVNAADVDEARRDWAYGVLAAATTWVKPRFKRRRKKETTDGRFSPVPWQRLVTDIGDRVDHDHRAWHTICGALKANRIPVRVAEQAAPVLTVTIPGHSLFTGELSLDATARRAGLTRSKVMQQLSQAILSGATPTFGKAHASSEVLVPEKLQESAEAAEIAHLEALFAAPAHGEDYTPQWRPVASGPSAGTGHSSESPASAPSPVSAPSPEEAVTSADLDDNPVASATQEEITMTAVADAPVVEEQDTQPAPEPVPVVVAPEPEPVYVPEPVTVAPEPVAEPMTMQAVDDARDLLESFVSFARDTEDQSVRRSIVERVLQSAQEEVAAAQAETDRAVQAMLEADNAARSASAAEKAAHGSLTEVQAREQEHRQVFQAAMEAYQAKVNEGQELQEQQESARQASAAEAAHLEELLRQVEDARMRVDAANRAVDFTVEQIKVHQTEMDSQVRPAVDTARSELDTFRGEVLTPAQQSFAQAQQQRAAAQARLEEVRAAAEQVRQRLVHARAVRDSLANQ